MAAERALLETANARYEDWSAKTASSRETAGRAKAELHRRGIQPATAGPEQQSTLEWWREFEADVKPPATHSPASTRPPSTPVSHGRPSATPKPSRKPSTHPSRELHTRTSETPVLERIHQVERAARLDQLQARTDEAVTRIVEQRAELTASSEYTARIEREAQAEPEPT